MPTGPWMYIGWLIELRWVSGEIMRTKSTSWGDDYIVILRDNGELQEIRWDPVLRQSISEPGWLLTAVG